MADFKNPGDGEAVAAGCALFIVAIAAYMFFTGWLIMLSVGIVHGIFGWPDFTISYWEGVALTIPLMVLKGIFASARNTNS